MYTQIFRIIIMYAVVIVALRVMGKRQLGELQPSEFVITLLVSELAALPMQDAGIPLFMGIVPIVLLLSIEVLVSFVLLKCRPARDFISGKSVPVIHNGKINQKNLKNLRQTVDDLLKELRLKDAFDLDSVIYAQIETNGKLSVLLAPQSGSQKESFAQLIIADGNIIKDNLKNSGYDMKWLEKTISKNGAKSPKDVFLLTVDEQGKVVFLAKDKGAQK